MAVLLKLGREEKLIIASWLDKELKDEEFPQSEMDIVNERLRRLDEGLSILIPFESAVARLDEKWGS